MAKGPLVTPQVEALITSIYDKHPKWRAPEIRNTVEAILRERNRKSPRGWPSLSKVQKVLAKVRVPDKLSREDEPWSTATLAEFPIPPEALPTILHLWVWTRENLNIEFTIREARWAARLYTVANNMSVGFFSIICRAHAATERIYERIRAPRTAWHSLDLFTFQKMIGQEITPERIEKISGKGEEEWHFALTEGEWARFKELSKSSELGELNWKEVKNERVNKTKK